MKTILKDGWLVLVPQSDEERAELAAWKDRHAGHVLCMQSTEGKGVSLFDLGLRADACREPVQILSMVKDPSLQLISNFAHTPFVLDGRDYASVEGFWQGLKFDNESDRRRVAQLHGKKAKQAGEAVEYGPTVTYEGESIAVGTSRHWALMRRACEAKFTQCDEAREALLATKERPLVHRMRKDSKTIPGVVMADIWMGVRARLQTPVEVEA